MKKWNELTKKEKEKYKDETFDTYMEFPKDELVSMIFSSWFDSDWKDTYDDQLKDKGEVK